MSRRDDNTIALSMVWPDSKPADDDPYKAFLDQVASTVPFGCLSDYCST